MAMTTRRMDAVVTADARRLAELTTRLHDGPLYSIAALHREAAALATASEAGADCDVTRLAQLAQLAEGTLVRFQVFTGELHKLIGELAARPPRRVER
jgi:predicted transcriptional regulator